MVRVDVVYADLSGVYIDGKWQEAEQVDCCSTDIPAENEHLYVLGSAVPIIIEQGPPRREWTIRLKVTDAMDIKINDAEVHFWNHQREYRWAREQYVIEEMTL